MSYKVIDGEYTRWYKDGTKILHREDGPAIEQCGGIKSYLIDGFLHRKDGPAVEYTDGSKYYYINGAPISKFSPDGYKYSDEEMLIVLKLIAFI